MSARAATEPTIDAGYTTAGAFPKAKLSVSFLTPLGSLSPGFNERHSLKRRPLVSLQSTRQQKVPDFSAVIVSVLAIQCSFDAALSIKGAEQSSVHR
jgi:hypothetical protein